MLKMAGEWSEYESDNGGFMGKTPAVASTGSATVLLGTELVEVKL